MGITREEAVARLAALHAAQQEFYAGGSDVALRRTLTADVAWHVPGRNAIAGSYRGLDAVLGYFARRRDLARNTFRLEPGEVLVGDGCHAAVLTDGTATLGGRERRWSTVGLYRFDAGLVAACWLLPKDPEAFDAIWGRPRSQGRS
jgi:hypothetical protein